MIIFFLHNLMFSIWCLQSNNMCKKYGGSTNLGSSRLYSTDRY